MKKLLGIFISFLQFFSLALCAFEELGKIDSARKTHPEIFIPKSIHEIIINGQLSYVFAGQAEQLFSGEFSESESELYEEATLDAKSFFYEKLSKGNKLATVAMSRCSVLYRYNDKKNYIVILFVPKDFVQVSVQNQKKCLPIPVSSRKKNSSKNQATVSGASTNSLFNKNIASEKHLSEHLKTPLGDQSSISVIERRKRKYISKLEKNPNDFFSAYNLAKMYENENNLEFALKYYQISVDLASKDIFFDSQEKTNMILSAAQLCERLGKNQLALKYYYLILKCDTSQKIRQLATTKISQLRLKTME